MEDNIEFSRTYEQLDNLTRPDKALKVLLLSSSDNSLRARLLSELNEFGHAASAALAGREDEIVSAVEAAQPDVILSVLLHTPLPETVWRNYLCLVVHPGIPGDRGPHALDRAIQRGVTKWGVTVLQVLAKPDGGPIWSSVEIPMRVRPISKSALYRHELADAAVYAVIDALNHFQDPDFHPESVDYSSDEVKGCWHPAMTQYDRAIDWSKDTTADVVGKIRAADSYPGVLDHILGQDCYLFGAHEEDVLKGPPGKPIAQRDGAVCLGTTDGAVWISHLRAKPTGLSPTLKLPAAEVLGAALETVSNSPMPFTVESNRRSFRDITYTEFGPLGFINFNLYNGALGTEQAQGLQEALLHARSQRTQVIVLFGGRDQWCTGMDLNRIEAAASPEDETWRNLLALNDLAKTIITTDSHLVVAALQGNASAGGMMLALGADQIYARRGVVLKPHYRALGRFHGSEMWTYSLPRRVGADRAKDLVNQCRDLSAREAQRMGLIDECMSARGDKFREEVIVRALDMVRGKAFAQLLADKRARRQADEAQRPLSAYRMDELAKCWGPIFNSGSDYHEARRRFVYRHASLSSATQAGRTQDFGLRHKVA